ncbi:MAG: ABC transporter permease [archaeon]
MQKRLRRFSRKLRSDGKGLALRTLWKDLLYFLRSRNSLILLLLVPVLTVAILGNVFNEKTASGISVLVCSSGDAIGEAYFSALSSGPFRAEISGDSGCLGSGLTRISSGNLSAIILVPKGASEDISSGIGRKVQVYYDNSREDVSSLILTYASGITQEISGNVSESFIGRAWEGLSRMGVELEISGVQLEQARGRLSEVSAKMDSAKLELENLSILSLEKRISETSGFLSEQKAQLISANGTLDVLKARLESANGTLNESLLLLTEADALLAEDISMTEGILDSARAVEGLVNYSACLPGLCPNISFAGQVLEPLEERVWREKTMRERISKISQNLTLMQSELENVSAGAENLTAGLGIALSKLGGAEIALAEVSETLSEFSEIRNYSLRDLEYSAGIFANITSEINKAIPRLEDARKALETIYSRDPETVVSPLAVEETEAFSSKGFSYIFPSIAAIVLMFNLLLLGSGTVLFERKSGTLLRTSLAGKGTLFFILSKAAILTLLGLGQTLLMTLMGRLFFSLRISNPPGFFLGIVLVSLMFSLGGILVGFLVRDESSALLAVVGFSIPSLFLSGGLFSFEFLPASLKSVSGALPLAVSSEALRVFGVYEGANVLAFSGIALYSLAIFAIATVLSGKRLE